ncbi:MAG TPA: tRNA-uridine aminocarboxypropyltransferase [Anaeromyxobacteraceae bacterium]|nr:tRNA-uridine aminocarboxypropyltransferase [Anaeromyxobacteraceae bacterium]
MRDRCLRCLRPTTFCCCRELAPIPSQTRVVILQHPREARLAICSAWLAHVALPSSEIHQGVSFERNERVLALAATTGAALLYPGPDATPAATAEPPPLLFVVDGTWPQAVKMLRDSPTLSALPRISVAPTGPGAYGDLRREPGPEHLSTIEAIALALGTLERAPERFAPMCAAFRRSVALQLECARGESRNPRHRPARGRRPRDASGNTR